jgi:ESCRT-II complex subunit VPS25
MSKAAFSWPQYYSFPPFFTLQSMPETREKQLQMWCGLVTQWAEFNKVKEIHVGKAKDLELFYNKEINRQLDEGTSCMYMYFLLISQITH